MKTMKPRRFRGKLLAANIVLLPLLALALWTAITLNYTYSDGERIGFLNKLSRKGWLCKTWEGELALSNVPGSMPEIFHFTVRGDAVAAKINAVAGKRVALHYDQHKGIPLSCFGETQYFVTDVTP